MVLFGNQKCDNTKNSDNFELISLLLLKILAIVVARIRVINWSWEGVVCWCTKNKSVELVKKVDKQKSEKKKNEIESIHIFRMTMLLEYDHFFAVIIS